MREEHKDRGRKKKR